MNLLNNDDWRTSFKENLASNLRFSFPLLLINFFSQT